MSADTVDDSISAELDEVFSRNSSNEVAVAHGFGAQIKIHHGQLTIRDGIGRHRRERSYGKADRTLRRIVVTAVDGYVTLDALTWCSEHDIAVTTVNPDGQLVSHHATTQRTSDAKLQRRQVAAAGTDTGLQIARTLLRRKVIGQGDNILKLFSDANISARLYHRAEQMLESPAIDQREHDSASLTELEGWASKDYFATWPRTLAVPFDGKSLARIPANWTVYPGRSSMIVGDRGKHHASDPVNAMLNFAYTLGYTECRIACIAYGLNPMLGFIHYDKKDRDSLALDVLETIRPTIDAYILNLIGIGAGPRTFTHRDFTEPYGYEPGTVRLVAPLTHEIAEASYQWEPLAHDAVKAVVNLLTGHHGKTGTLMPNLQLQKTTFVNEQISVDELLTEAEYKRRFGAIVPPFPRPRTGHPPIPNRIILAAIIHCERNHRPWTHVPDSLGVAPRTMMDRRRMWQRSGHWGDIKLVIDELALLPS